MFARLFRSSKFLAAVIGSVVPVLNVVFGLELAVEELAVFVAPFIAYIAGTAYEDGKKGEKKAEK